MYSISRIAILYRVTQGPWGGGNSFLRSLQQAWLALGVNVTDHLNASLEGVLVNSSYLGPGQRLLPQMAKRMVKNGYPRPVATWLGLSRWQERRPVFVHRLDGVFKNYGRSENNPADLDQIGINSYLDWTIFQSEYCRQSFAAEGLDTSRSTVVFNGVDLGVFFPAPNVSLDKPLRLVSVAWSSNVRKGFRSMVEASELPGVEVTFIGNWPQGIPAGEVKLIPPQPHGTLAKLLRQHQAMLHMAQNDPCSNAILEGLASGLPVIYHPSGGSPEIVGPGGIAGFPSLDSAVEEMRDRYTDLRNTVLEKRPEISIDRAARAYLEVFERTDQERNT